MPKRACKQCDQFNIVYKRGDIVIPKFCGRACMDAFFADKNKADQERRADAQKHAQNKAGAPKRGKLVKIKPKKKKPKSIARLVDDAAVLLQKLVRMKAAMASVSGMCACVTCGKLDHWTNLQGGHFIERGRRATKLIEENCAPQCAGCNMYRMKTASGVLAYRQYMVDMYGEKFVQDLIQESKRVKNYTRSEVEGIIFDFKRQIEIQNRRLSGRTIGHKREEAA